jgi:nitroreductase
MLWIPINQNFAAKSDDMSTVKLAKNEYPIIDLIRERWSRRAFSEQPVSTQQMMQLFEAARWAPSANNEQPWVYWYALKGSEGFSIVLDCLSAGNQPWAINAAAFIICLTRKHFEGNLKENYYALHDIGMANMNLMIQALSMGIYTHIMAGLDKNKLIERFEISAELTPVCVMAAGFPGSPEMLDEPYKTRELTERHRKSVSEFTVQLN